MDVQAHRDSRTLEAATCSKMILDRVKVRKSESGKHEFESLSPRFCLIRISSVLSVYTFNYLYLITEIIN